MAITDPRQPTYYNHRNGPCIGDTVKDPVKLCTMVFDGEEWIELFDDWDNPMTKEEIMALLHHRSHLTAEFLEEQYPDLKMLRLEFEKEYEQLAEKYRVFEVLKRKEPGYGA